MQGAVLGVVGEKINVAGKGKRSESLWRKISAPNRVSIESFSSEK